MSSPCSLSDHARSRWIKAKAADENIVASTTKSLTSWIVIVVKLCEAAKASSSNAFRRLCDLSVSLTTARARMAGYLSFARVVRRNLAFR